MTINAAWHEANPMPAKATFEERLAWHVAHAAACGCRQMPKAIHETAVARGLVSPDGKVRRAQSA